ncbi:Calmodulin-regulated spectrin-associated protein 1 [Holothuria leucospilota]|uniref:Calmodulin-regulated spectrin-associated protein 1 n=1 Tax=Holothuria leucospilota TaxID=206669 RepID=A0A9Q1BCP2_HOLLE|nr:Calmodulin-regulated spectrin-associated protein 1 [Holothuria leucospilota]
MVPRIDSEKQPYTESMVNKLSASESMIPGVPQLFEFQRCILKLYQSVTARVEGEGVRVGGEGRSSHQAMIGAIMKAYAKEVVPVEAVVKAVRQIATFNASSELPFDQEDALLFWINKVCSSVRHRLERERKAQQEQLMQSAQQTVRLRRDQLHPKQLPFIPVLDDLMKDLSDGCCLAILVSFYCPHLLPFEDIVLRENMSFADSLHNLQLLKTFFKKYLPETFHFTFEDLLYTHDSLKPSIIAFCSELFHVFEVTKPDHLSANQFKGKSD